MKFFLAALFKSEIAFSWLRVAIRNDYQPAYPRLESYLIKPLYEDLLKTPAGAARARAIYAQARPNYHVIAVATLDGIVLPRAR